MLRAAPEIDRARGVPAAVGHHHKLARILACRVFAILSWLPGAGHEGHGRAKPSQRLAIGVSGVGRHARDSYETLIDERTAFEANTARSRRGRSRHRDGERGEQ